MPLSGQFSPLDPEASATLVEAIGAPELGAALLEIARATAEVDELFAYLVLDGADPEVLVTQSVLDGAEQRVADYVARFYRHDPAVQEIRRTVPGSSFMRRIAPNRIIPHDYRRRCFAEPGFSEKLSFGWRGEGYLIVLSFYRTQSGARSALSRLASLASMTLTILVRHHAPIGLDSALGLVERRLRRSFPALSSREVAVCARTIMGWPASRTAETLGLSPGTVLTYRQRAYQKAGISCAGEFVPMILR